ncbi:MAG: VWA domain-containing protein [Myxococcales bacterium]
MKRTLVLVALTLTGAACADYLIDRPGGGGFADTGPRDASVRDGGFADEPDTGPAYVPDTGFGGVCSAEVKPIKLNPLDLLVVLDVSYSMDYDQKWLAVKSAMKSFVSNPDFKGLGVGLQYFPLRTQCKVDAYELPAVPIGTLGAAMDVGEIIKSSLDLQQMSGGTPTVPMLEGATAYLKGWLRDHPDHRAVLVVATDGMPDQSCTAVTEGLPNSLANVIAVADEAAKGTPSVKTFVIGVGDDLSTLDQFAKAGGTDRALLVNVKQNADVAFLNALTQIRRDALGCEFAVPDLTTIIRDQAQVRFEPDDGSGEQLFPQVDGRDFCGNGQGWYFDDPEDPRKLILCNQTCESVTQGKTGVLNVEFACSPT